MSTQKHQVKSTIQGAPARKRKFREMFLSKKKKREKRREEKYKIAKAKFLPELIKRLDCQMKKGT